MPVVARLFAVAMERRSSKALHKYDSSYTTGVARMLKFLSSAVGIIFIIGLLVVIGLLALVF